MDQLKGQDIFKVAQDQERIPYSNDNNSGIRRDNANLVHNNSQSTGKKTGFVQRAASGDRSRLCTGIGVQLHGICTINTDGINTKQRQLLG
jgi:hypothetical protein